MCVQFIFFLVPILQVASVYIDPEPVAPSFLSSISPASEKMPRGMDGKLGLLLLPPSTLYHPPPSLELFFLSSLPDLFLIALFLSPIFSFDRSKSRWRSWLNIEEIRFGLS